MKSPKQIFPVLFICLAAAFLITGCATKKTTAAKKEYLFFPPAPDEPRIQYLTSFGSESDLGGGSGFTDFVVGSQRMYRPIWKPYGVAVTKGTVNVCDTQPANITVIDLVKKKFRYIRPGGQDAMALPINVAVDTDGTRYVTDTKRGQVLLYGANDTLAGEIGKRGEMKPCGIALSADRIYVSDLSNHCVNVYNKAKRELLFSLPRDKDEHSKLHSPTNLSVDEDGNIYVSDSGGFATHVFDPNGKHLRMIGEQGLEAGRFALPKGIAVDRAKRVYVVDAATAVIQMFNEEGKLLMYFGEPKSSGLGALYLPAGIAIDYENVGLFEKYVAPGKKIEHLIFVTNQAGPQKVSVYGFLKKS